MPLIKETKSFATTADFELGFEHCSRETDYHIVLPETDSDADSDEIAKGLVVYVPGFGKDAGDYRHVFCQKIAENYDLAAMAVDYHCFFSRPDSLESVVYEAQDVALIEKLFMKHKQPFAGTSVEEGIEILNQYLAKNNLTEEITATLIPGKNEYQNGGVLQALDVINAVAHAIEKYCLPAENVILVGSSYGGYIANLATKFAPKTFRAVFDNSSWAHPNFIYVVGRENGIPEFKDKLHSHIETKFYMRTAWTLKKGLPYTFDGKRYHVRSFLKAQIEQFANYQPETYYYFIHAEEDKIAVTEVKVQMASEMIQAGLHVQMEVMDAKDVDGTYIKTIEHGMQLSMLTFFDKAYSHIKAHQVSADNDFVKQSKVVYDSSECRYEFDFSTLPVKGRVLSSSEQVSI